MRPFIHLYDSPLTARILKFRWNQVLNTYAQVPASTTHDLIVAARSLTRNEKLLDDLNIISDPSVVKSPAVIRSLLTIRPLPNAEQSVDYVSALPTNTINVREYFDLLSLATRKCIYENKLDLAMDLVSTTKIFVMIYNQQELRFRNYFRIASASLFTIAAIFHSLDIWFSFPAALIIFGQCRMLLNKWAQPDLDRVRWHPKLPISYRIARSTEIILVNRILQAYDQSTASVETYHLGIVSTAVAAEPAPPTIKNQRLIPEISPSQKMYNQYWATAGENFAWVEPDQDPCDGFIGSTPHQTQLATKQIRGTLQSINPSHQIHKPT